MKHILTGAFCLLAKLSFSQNVDYSIPLFNSQTFVKTINTALPVGSINGEPNVSGSGSAGYLIPIEVSPGTNGVVPKVSINYNSMAGNGPVGFGWTIGGLSVISRTGQNMYHHNQVTAVDLSLGDRFSLDGQVLLGTAGNYGANGAKYGLENENFATIISNGITGNGPTWFKVVSKDGSELEFGNTSDSKVMDESNVNVLIWRINRIKQPDGNYIDFKYIFTDRDSRIDEINYTGNAATGLAPYNKIKFEYKVRADINTTYLAGQTLVSKYLLDKITVTAEGSAAKSYHFGYSWDNINSYLREITESGSDASNLNSTIFKYGDTPPEYTNTLTTIPTGNNVESFSGDYDGDGLDDILTGIYTTNNGIKFYSDFKVFKRSAANASYSLLSTTPLAAGTSLVKIGRSGLHETKNASSLLQDDFNGDGLADVLSLNISVQGNDLFLSNVTVYKSTNAGASFTPQTRAISLPTGTKINVNGNYFHAGDFNGDGILEFITILATAANKFTPVLHKDFVSGGSAQEITISGPSAILAKDWVDASASVLDFNGDGKSDLLVVGAQTSEVYTFNGAVAVRIYSGAFPTMQQTLSFGDFNGDGLTDILASGGKVITKGTSTGKGFFLSTQVLAEPMGNSPCPGNRSIYVGDFDGDGKSDFVHDWFLANEFPINNSQPGNDPSLQSFILYEGMNVYYSRGDDFFKKEIYKNSKNVNGSCNAASLGLRKYVQADLNGDSRTDLALYNNTATILCSSFNLEGKQTLLHKVADGFGYISEWNYKTLTQGGSFYSKNAASFYPVNSVQPTVLAVSELKTPDGIGGTASIQYQYEDARLHRAGKGYLGFRKVTSTDVTSGIKTVSENEFNDTYYIHVLKQSKTYLASSNALLTETTLENEFIPQGANGSKRFLHRVKSTLENNIFEDRKVSTSNNAFDNYGNVTQQTVNNSNVQTVITTSVFGAFPGTIPNKPTSITVSTTRNAQAPFTVTTALGYNAIGQLTSKTDFSGMPKSVQTTFEYFPLGNLKKTTITPTGLAARSTSAVYDSKGRFPASGTNELGQTNTTTYDPKWGKPLSTTGISGLKTSFTYDAFGRLTTTAMPEGYSVTNSLGWDIGNGAVWYSNTTHPGKPDVKIWYDLLGRQIKSETEGFQNQPATELTTYDAMG